jgi:transposase-like protein
VAFKTEIVQLVQENGKHVAEVSRELAIADNLLYHWHGEEHNPRCLGPRPDAALKAEVPLRLDRGPGIVKMRNAII